MASGDARDPSPAVVAAIAGALTAAMGVGARVVRLRPVAAEPRPLGAQDALPQVSRAPGADAPPLGPAPSGAAAAPGPPPWALAGRLEAIHRRRDHRRGGGGR